MLTIPIQFIKHPLLVAKKLRLGVLRLDYTHPQIMGNKWFKLMPNIHFAQERGYNSLLTFGGAFSNHIYATAAAGSLYGLKTIGIIRGEERLPLNSTLGFAQAQGMQLIYISRSAYRQKNEPAFIAQWQAQFPYSYIIPEGGSNALAVEGCQNILNHIPIDFDYIATACGTGSTLAGLTLGLQAHQRALGFAVLKQAQFLYAEVAQWQTALAQKNIPNYHIFLDYHFGGYAKVSPELQQFCQEFSHLTQIPIEPIYTGKMFVGLWDLIKHDYFAPEKIIIALHTGGLRNDT